MTAGRTLILGTRTSNLARWQTDYVAGLLQTAWPELGCVIRPFVTQGDKTLDKPLPEIGGKGLFTLELEEAIRCGEIDLAVHSLKDLPVEDAPGLTVGAIIGRADVRDVLVGRNGWSLVTLPDGAAVGTSSRRREAQLLAVRPDLKVRSIRGNVETRIRKVMDGDYDATVLAAAGVERLGLSDLVTDWLPLATMLPAPGQGALAVQCRTDDAALLAFLGAIDASEVRRAVTAERAFLSGLGGGCSAPVGAYAQVLAGGDGRQLHLEALVAALDGSREIRLSGKDADPVVLGQRLAEQALAQGAATLVNGVGQAAVPDVMTAARPLAGKRIVVTRSREQAADFSQKLRRLGAIPVEIPMIEIVPLRDLSVLDEAIGDLGSYDWLVLSSRNAVEIFCDRLAAVAPEKVTLAAIRVAAVGPATADALVERGRKPDFVPEAFVGEEIAAGLGEVAGRSILLPRARQGRREVVDLLLAQGAVVADVPIYDTIPALPDAAAVAALAGGVDVLTFTSSSTVANFATAFAETIDRLTRESVVVCIGPVTATTAIELGLTVDVVARDYTIDGILDALVAYFERVP